MAHISSFRTGTLLLLFPLLTLLASTARANVYKLGDVWVDVNTSNLTATVVADPNGTKYSGNITIQPFFDVGNYHFTVNSIGSRAFYNCTG